MREKKTEKLEYELVMENIHIYNWSPTGFAEDKNNWRNNDHIVSKVDENYKHTDPRSSVKLKEKNNEEKQRGTSLSNYWKPVIKNLTNSRRKRTLLKEGKKS